MSSVPEFLARQERETRRLQDEATECAELSKAAAALSVDVGACRQTLQKLRTHGGLDKGHDRAVRSLANIEAELSKIAVKLDRIAKAPPPPGYRVPARELQ